MTQWCSPGLDQMAELALPAAGSIPFPWPVEAERTRLSARVAREGEPVMIYADDALVLSVLAVGVLVRLTALWQAGEALSAEALAELHPDDLDDVLTELFAAEALCRPEAYAALRVVRAAEREAELAARRAARKAPRQRLVAPDPWPSPSAGRWTGTRDEYYGVERTGPPSVTGVYLLHDDAGRLLYVGQSKDLGSRIGGHFDKPWTRYVARECPDLDTSLWLEAGEIRWGKPLLNRDRDCRGRCAALPARRPKGSAL